MKYLSPLALSLAAVFLLPTIAVDSAIAQPSQDFQIARRRRALSWRVGVRPSLRRVGAFSRSGSCPNQTQVTAFVPPPQATERGDKTHGTVDSTVASHPTFWVYVANLPPQAQMQFTLQNTAGTEELHNTRFVLKRQTGLVGVRLPKTSPGLKVGESYLWQVTVQCPSAASLYIGSWVQRITLDQVKSTPTFEPKPLIQALKTASDREKPALYAALGIWPDAVTMIIDQQQKQPNNQELKEDWQNLLTGAQMSDLINAPILLVH